VVQQHDAAWLRAHQTPLIAAGRVAPQMKESALIRAAHNGHLHSVKHLLEAGADVNALDLVRASAMLESSCPVLAVAARGRLRRRASPGQQAAATAGCDTQLATHQ
jgi:hypothetical protein